MTTDPPPQFIFTCCQRGAEAALKSEMARSWPDLRFAFSRPGFVTFKLPDDASTVDGLDLGLVFARTWGFSLGRVEGQDAGQLVEQAVQLAGSRKYNHLHVWQRDASRPGQRGFEPGPTPLAAEVGRLITGPLAQAAGRASPLPINRRAAAGDLVFDCVLVEPGQWWLGFHQANDRALRSPGGVIRANMPQHAVSRAYLKMAEALLWSRLPLAPGDACVEIGSAPGGSCQALLDRGLKVTGIDPSEMDESLLAASDFTHIKKRAADMKRREFRPFKWLFADLNVAPKYTLDALEDIVTHPTVHVQGMLITLKLLDWQLAEQLPEHLARIRQWGFRYVRARQLAHNRQELCVLALRRRSLRRQSLLQRRALVKTAKKNCASPPSAGENS